MKITSYKTANVMRSLVASLIILASFSGIANAENSNKEAIAIVENGYNAKEFVEADLALENESWLNSNGETYNKVAEPELALQYAGYNAKEFVEAELSFETASRMNNATNSTRTETTLRCSSELANN